MSSNSLRSSTCLFWAFSFLEHHLEAVEGDAGLLALGHFSRRCRRSLLLL